MSKYYEIHCVIVDTDKKKNKVTADSKVYQFEKEDDQLSFSVYKGDYVVLLCERNTETGEYMVISMHNRTKNTQFNSFDPKQKLINNWLVVGLMLIPLLALVEKSALAILLYVTFLLGPFYLFKSLSLTLKYKKNKYVYDAFMALKAIQDLKDASMVLKGFKIKSVVQSFENAVVSV